MKEQFNISIKKYKINLDVHLLWLTYFPFIGWLYPFIFKKDDAFAMHHGKQAFIMALLFTAIPIAITFSAAFIPITWRVIKLIFAILIYLSHLAYFALCAWGLLKVWDRSAYEFPVIMRFAKKLDV
ncbi:MAG: hypothetical protein A2176_04350 [Spirochaetes bacterium RBG_13_51_14]|nr:MAG: hypothetical protein A2176_04350 [Spirochaetes bacterium RBG_13_51_14]